MSDEDNPRNLTFQEIRYLMACLKQIMRQDVFRGGNRDYYAEDLQERIEKKLQEMLK